MTSVTTSKLGAKPGSVSKPGPTSTAPESARNQGSMVMIAGVAIVVIVAVAGLVFILTRPAAAPTEFDFGPAGKLDPNNALSTGKMKRSNAPDSSKWKPVDCFDYDKYGANYDGSIKVTKSGLACVPWSEKYPSSLARYFWKKSIYYTNGCANPTWSFSQSQMIWCFINYEDNYDWEACEVPRCAGCLSDDGTTYTGGHSRKGCWNWTQTDYKPKDFFGVPDLASIKNYCRNPTNMFPPHGPMFDEPACLAYGSILFCSWLKSCHCGKPKPDRLRYCFIHQQSGGYTQDYVGTKSTTKSGIKCKPWERDTSTSKPPNSYCRHKANSTSKHYKFPWCYIIVNNKKKRETCGIPRCNCYGDDLG